MKEENFLMTAPCCRECGHLTPGHFSDCLVPELTKLKADVVRLRKLIQDADTIIGHAEFHRSVGCVIFRKQIQDFKTRALEETK